MNKDTTKHLTDGRPLGLILSFSIPVLIGMLFQQFYSLVDTMIVGKTLGVHALGAVGSTGAVNFLVNGFCMGVCAGFAIPVAQAFGAEDYPRLRKYVSNSIWLSGIIAVFLTTVVVIFTRQILVIMQTPEDILDQAYSYIVIIFLAIPVTILYNLTSGVIRSLGDSRTPVYFLLIASLINIGLDFLFIVGFHTGVAGAAVATVISQLVSGVLCVLFIIKRFKVLIPLKGEWRIERRLVNTLLGNALPMGLQYSITAIGSVILQTAINSLGSDTVAAVTSANRMTVFLVCPLDALGSTMATYMGQNVGAGKYERLKKGIFDASFLGLIYSVIGLLLVFFFRNYLLLLFVDRSEKLIMEQAGIYMLTQACFYFPLALVNIVRFSIQGMGYSTLAVLAGVAEMVARMLVALIYVPIYGLYGAAFASPVAWVFADAFLIPAFFFVYRRLKRKFTRSPLKKKSAY